MTYRKPEDVTYTQMAIWIDEHVYTPDFDVDTLYQYLYHLVNMLAQKFGYFDCAAEYDNFSLYCASRFYFRLTNKKQFEFDDSGNPKMKRIKSILNYLKKSLTHCKTDYELEFNVEKKVDTVCVEDFYLQEYLVDNASLFDQLEFSYTSQSLDKIVRAHLQKIPFKKDSPEWLNIYTSCILTLLDSITLTNTMKGWYDNKKYYRYEFLTRLYNELRKQPPILFHLPPTMSNYITVLVNELRHVIAAEISWGSQYHISSEQAMKDMMAAAFNNED